MYVKNSIKSGPKQITDRRSSGSIPNSKKEKKINDTTISQNKVETNQR